MFTYIHIYSHIFSHICSHIYIYILTYSHIFTYIHIYSHIYVHIYSHIFTYILTYMFTYIYIYIYIFSHIHIYSHIYSHIYVHIYSHIFTYTYLGYLGVSEIGPQVGCQCNNFSSGLVFWKKSSVKSHRILKVTRLQHLCSKPTHPLGIHYRVPTNIMVSHSSDVNLAHHFHSNCRNFHPVIKHGNGQSMICRCFYHQNLHL